MKRALQILFKLILNLKWEAVWTFVSHPLFVIPTIRSTIESIILSEDEFKESPRGNGIANAYRHAVWNVLMIYYCSSISSTKKSMVWTEKITNLHEKLFPNHDYDRKMDLHNNAVGRKLYVEALKSGNKTKRELLDLVKKKAKSAIGLTDEYEFSKFKNDLVFYPLKK